MKASMANEVNGQWLWNLTSDGLLMIAGQLWKTARLTDNSSSEAINGNDRKLLWTQPAVMTDDPGDDELQLIIIIGVNQTMMMMIVIDQWEAWRSCYYYYWTSNGVT